MKLSAAHTLTSPRGMRRIGPVMTGPRHPPSSPTLGEAVRCPLLRVSKTIEF